MGASYRPKNTVTFEGLDRNAYCGYGFYTLVMLKVSEFLLLLWACLHKEQMTVPF